MSDAVSGPRRCGRVALLGRPNAGKSTLLNRLLGEKVAIVSDKPQTTRHRIVGIHSEPRGQIIFLDTPGMHRPLHRMNRNMVKAAESALAEADVALLLIDVTQPAGGGDRYMLELLDRVPKRRFALLNKIDLVAKERILPRIAELAEGDRFAQIVPVSALDGDGCDLLLDLLFAALPEAPPIYDEALLTPHAERFLAAEQIREKVLQRVEREVPFATAVLVERWEEEVGLVRIYAAILVERAGQKGIVVGKGGRMIKEIGTAARLELEDSLGKRVFLDLHVRVEPGWRESQALLAELEREQLADLR